MVLLDFDGTLAPIVDHPPQARPERGAMELLDELTRVYRTVGVVSGRPVAFIDPFLPSSVELMGMYGMERRVAGQVVTVPDAAHWRAAVERAIGLASLEGPSGVEIEDKGLSVTFHVRRAPDLAAELHALAVRMGTDTGLHVRPGKMAVELVPPLAVDKGVAVTQLIGEAKAALFVGDDLGDLPAFAALDQFAAAGGLALRVAVSGPEAPVELVEAADVVLDDQHEVLPFLRLLLESPS